ncbi:hypothetical protein [Paracoccus ravus]|uniref:hypothetical protein n=1 Tax=Paracoccus ravus TaxID=2447760 RepID=UPI00106E4155|nr:hypothetical protein [Paracoccus ravus]
MVNGVWYETDTPSDVLDSLVETARQLDRVKGDVAAWKWAILSMFGAVSGALVCHLSGSTQTGALATRSQTKTLAALEVRDGSAVIPDPYLASPLDLLRRSLSRRNRESPAVRICVSFRKRTAFKRLLVFRNDFTHFKPQSWSIECSGLPTIFQDVGAIICQISQDGWSFRHMTDAQRKELAAVLVEIEARLNDLADQYAKLS